MSITIRVWDSYPGDVVEQLLSIVTSDQVVRCREAMSKVSSLHTTEFEPTIIGLRADDLAYLAVCLSEANPTEDDSTFSRASASINERSRRSFINRELPEPEIMYRLVLTLWSMHPRPPHGLRFSLTDRHLLTIIYSSTSHSLSLRGGRHRASTVGTPNLYLPCTRPLVNPDRPSSGPWLVRTT